MDIRYGLQTTGKDAFRLSDRRYRKDAIRVGRFIAKNPDTGDDLELNVTPERMKRWLGAFERMRQNGQRVNLTKDHSHRATDKHGEVVGMTIDGDTLYFEADAQDDEAEKVITRSPEVSVEIEPDFRDGSGNQYGEAITAISICQNPVVGGQGPFQRVAASQDSGTAKRTVIMLSANTAGDTRTNPPERTNMFTEDQLKQLRTDLGLDDKAEAKDVLAKIGDFKGVTAKVEDLTKQNKTLSDQVDSLQKGQAPEVDEDTLEESADNANERLNRLVDDGKLTPAAKDKLAASLIGPEGKRNAICLSRKAAKHAGYDKPLVRAVIEALQDNNPVDLKPKTGPQVVTLSRNTPGVDNNDTSAGDELVKINNGEAEGGPVL